MEDLVPFKVFCFWQPGDKIPEVRWFSIEKSVVTSYHSLNAKLLDVFPGLKAKSYTVQWKDEDGDDITISSDDEIMIALSLMSSDAYKLYVTCKGSEEEGDFHVILTSFPDAGCDVNASQKGLVCAGCDCPVIGYRYMCTICPNYDLCPSCEASGVHPEHCMLRVPVQLLPRELIRAALNRSRHIINSVRLAAIYRNFDKKRRPSNWFDTFITYINEKGIDIPGFEKEPNKNSAHTQDNPVATATSASPSATTAHSKYPLRIRIKSRQDLLDVLAKQLTSLDAVTKEIGQGNKKSGSNIKETEALQPAPAAAFALKPCPPQPFPSQPFSPQSFQPRMQQQPFPRLQQSFPLQMPPQPYSQQPQPYPYPQQPQPQPYTLQMPPQPFSLQMPRSQTSPHIIAALGQMLSMGFTNDGGWLTQLLENKNGNIAAVLELFTPVNNKRT